MIQDDYFKLIKSKLSEFSERTEYIGALEQKLLLKNDSHLQPVSSHTDSIRVQSNAPKDRLAESVADLETLRQKLADLQETHQQQVEELQDLCTTIRCANERATMEFFYLECDSWQAITFFLFGTRFDYDDKLESYQRQVYRLRNRVINRWAQICVENAPEDRHAFLQHL